MVTKLSFVLNKVAKLSNTAKTSTTGLPFKEYYIN